MLKPQGKKPTGAPPRTIEGVTFRCYHTGITQYEWWSDDGRFAVYGYFSKSGYSAWVDGHLIQSAASGHGKNFRTFDNAVKAIVKTSFKVGDVVTWASTQSKLRKKPPMEGTAEFTPMRVVGCKIVELGHTAADTGEPAAVIEAMGQKISVRVADLTREN